MMIENGQHYLTWVPGEHKPKKRPDGSQVWWYGQWQASETFVELWKYNIRRWPVSEAEHRAHYYCLAHEIKIPEGYEVVKFGKSTAPGEKFVLGSGHPIVRKIEEKCSHANAETLGETTLRGEYRLIGYVCPDCGMVRRGGDWEEMNDG